MQNEVQYFSCSFFSIWTRKAWKRFLGGDFPLRFRASLSSSVSSLGKACIYSDAETKRERGGGGGEEERIKERMDYQ